MTGVIRLGLRDGLAVPVRASAPHFPHVLVIEDDSHPIPRSAVRQLHSSALMPQDEPGACLVAATLRFLSFNEAPCGARIIAYQVSYCAHVTRVGAVAEKAVSVWPSGITSTSANDLASLFADCARDFDPTDGDGSCQEAFVEVLVDRLSLNLSQSMGDLSVNDNVTNFGQSLDNVFARRRGLSEIEEFALAARVVPTTMTVLGSVITRSDSELLIALAAQMYRIDLSNRMIADATRAATRADAARDRRWGKLAAASIFPLILLSFLGANVLPQTLWGRATQGEGPVLVAFGMTLAASILGYVWVGRNRKGE